MLWCQFKIALREIVSASTLKRSMENLVKNALPLGIKVKHISVQCTIVAAEADSDNAACNTSLGDDENNDLADLSTGKRKISNSLESSKKHKKPKLNPKQARQGILNYNETSYYFENGLRKVYPYYFTFTTHTKARWVGRTLLEVFGNEFRAHSSEEYEDHIKKGSLTINNERVSTDYVLKHNDLLSNIVHRHEVPVTSDPIDIIYLDKNIVVVNKPASVPVHPCGRYRHNTMVFLLAKEHNLKDLKTIHRLDRLTSGVLMFGRTQSMAQKLEEQIRNRVVEKQYVCRVEGEFPESVECEEPIEVVSYKIGVCKVSPKGKVCSTSFKLIGYNKESNTSIVKCSPHSGRMHQIRVHLQYLGYPIKNDPLYNDTIFGPEKGRGGDFGKTDEQLIKELIFTHNAENWSENEKDSLSLSTNDNSIKPDLVTSNTDRKQELDPCRTRDVCTQTDYEPPDSTFDPIKLSVDPYCKECKTRYRDPKPKDLIMYLHAYQYSGPDWKYETVMPAWADVNWKEPC
ncbi:pseudouridylate synthase RPUSD2-like isoform X2 [Adelges cooleyi]|nr:pseudouridylate synthase RPUSD2-like isoform X2 [Adelges cooleyi]